jgi:2-oxoglutarate ferredoxin oxidoreductase subunit alpha
VFKLFEKYSLIQEREVLYEEYMTEDADFLMVGFGSLTRNIKAAIKTLRAKGIKAGLLRPITLFPFPTKRISELATQCREIMTVEMNMGQMFIDVRLAVNGKTKTTLLNTRAVGEWMSVEEIVGAVERAAEGVLC